MAHTLGLDKIPPVAQGDVRISFTGLSITPLGRAESLEAAWALLPAKGTGVVTLADRITRFDPAARSGLLVEADVAEDATTTVVLRADGDSWRAWRWTETIGTDHCAVERMYLSTEQAGGQAPGLVYRQYWTLQPRTWEAGDPEVKVWAPIGARFCGFEEAR